MKRGKSKIVNTEQATILYRGALSKVNSLSGLKEDDLSLIERVALRKIAVSVFERENGLSDTEAAVIFLSNYFDYAPDNYSVQKFKEVRRLKLEESGIDVLREHFKIQSKEYHKP